MKKPAAWPVFSWGNYRVKTLEKVGNEQSGERIFRGIADAFRLVVGNIFNAELAQEIEDGFAEVAEGHGTVMREALFNEHMAIEAAHFRDGEDADAAEGVRSGREDFAFGDVGAELAVRRALETVERDVARGDVAFERAARDVRRLAAFEQAVLDELVFHAALLELAERRVAAVEAHERVFEGVVLRALDVFFEEVARHGVVDVEQRDGIARDAEADVLDRKSTRLNSSHP